MCPSAYSEMIKGNLSFQKTNRQFARMALDQIHEQNNKVIKGVSGGTNLLNRADDSGLSRWELCGPDLGRLITKWTATIHIATLDTMKITFNSKKTFF